LFILSIALTVIVYVSVRGFACRSDYRFFGGR